MKKSYIKKAGCMFLCMAILTGCSLPGIGRLNQAYDLASRAERIWNVESGKADSFAKELCVVTDESQYQDDSVTAEAAAVFDVSGKTVVYSKNAFEKLYPASVTKILTALIAVKYGNLSDMVTVTEEAVITEAGATLAGIKPGDVVTMEQLLYGLMLPSGNDAGAAIAVHMAGSMERFSDMMNQEALALGATGSHFVNSHGLNDENHYTTAYDLYLIFNEALKQPEFRKVIGAGSYTATYQDAAGKSVSKTWKNSNHYITGEEAVPAGLTVLGGKTGTTKAAGNCLIMGSDDSGGKEYISVVLKADGRESLYHNMSNIISKIVD